MTNNLSLVRIAVLLTCFNRKQSTLNCLSSLAEQALPGNIRLSIYLVDDGSTDGTSAAVSKLFPSVNVLLGNGSLFWNGGMRLAFSEAIKTNYDYHLWLNDDTHLNSTALETLLSTYESLKEYKDPSWESALLERAIIVGAIQDPDTNKPTYGGIVRKSRWHPFKYHMLVPDGVPQRCQMMNGNCVLIPKAVFELVGNLDMAFSHSYGDFDYALRAIKQGCSIWTTPSYVGHCKRNPPQSTVWNDPDLSMRERFQKVNKPKGLPFREQRIFVQRHAGFGWPVFWLLPYVRLLLASLRKALNRKLIKV
jgi:GT2 family glycosyltransferase